ncbi:MAG: methyl-accepting chemotaxis protein [Bacillota bacterium]
MKWFYNLKIGAKLLISFITVTILTAFIGYMGISNMGKINGMLNNMYDNNLVPISDISGANMQAIYHNRAVYDYVVETDKSVMDQIKVKMDRYEEKMKEMLDSYTKTKLDDKEKDLIAKFDEAWLSYENNANKVLPLSYEGRNEEAVALLNGEVSKTFDVVDNLLSQLVNINKDLAKSAYDESDKVYSQSSTFLLTLIVICVLASIGLAFFISRIISNPVRKLVDIAGRIASGDLDVHVDIASKDEVGMLAHAFDTMANNINEVMCDINASSDQVASGARQVSESGQALSQGATEQASSIEEITSSMTEVAAQTKQNAQYANQANELSNNVKENAVNGNQQMQEMLKSMAEINDSSSNISKIIKVIDEIAFQTNILALNAAVEAARAGQHGKGFAVVAEEVRNLAARSANAAKETTDMIEGSIRKVEIGTKIANETAEALNKIVEGVTKTANLIADITSASNEQASGISQINAAIEQVAQVIQTNSASAEESASASEELSSQAELLKQAVSKFKLKKSISSDRLESVLSSDVIRMLENTVEKSKSTKTGHLNSDRPEVMVSNGSKNHLKKKISLQDDEFGKY